MTSGTGKHFAGKIVGGNQDGGHSYIDQTVFGDETEVKCNIHVSDHDPVGWIDHIYDDNPK